MSKTKRFKTLISLICFFTAVFLVNCDQHYENPYEDNRQERLERLLATYDQLFRDYLANARQTMGKEILEYSPLSDETTIPKYMEITGSHYEYGTLVGRIAQQYGHQPRRVTTDRAALNNRIIEMYQQVYPPYLEIARGVGEVFDIPMMELDFAYLEYDFFIDLWYSLFRYSHFRNLAGPGEADASLTSTHCSMLFARVGEDIFLGRNFDQDLLKPHFVVYSKMGEGYRVMANACYIPYHWIMDGVNEKGLFMGTANLSQPPEYYWNDPYPDEPAVCEHHLFRIALETCATVDEVIELYRSIRPWSPNGTDHLMVADALGDSAVIEFNMDREAVFFVRDENKDYQLITNIAYQEGMDYMMQHCNRFYRGTNLAEEGIAGFGDVEYLIREIGGRYGYTSFFDLKTRFMQLYSREDFFTPYDFDFPGTD